jgi:hypothetical protein
MLSKLTSHFQDTFRPDARYQNLAFICCVLFGLAMIANTQPAADGAWFWYAIYFNNGKHLYSNMRLAIQPLFVLETAWFLTVVGKGWLVSKIPAVLHVIAYCFGLGLLVRHTRLPDRQKALLLGGAFLVSVAFEAYRFDDYHVLTDCFVVYSIVLLLSLQKIENTRTSLEVVAELGILSGLALTTRLNDGGTLVIGVVTALWCLGHSRKLLAIVVFGFVSALVVVLIVSLTGDSFHDYAVYSVFKAAGIKGGATNVLNYPLKLPWYALSFMAVPWFAGLNLYCFAVAAAWAFASRSTGVRGLRRKLIWILLTLLPLHYLYRGLADSHLMIALSAIGIPMAYFVGALVFVRLIHRQFVPSADVNHREALFLIPLGQLVSGSMSSGGHHIGLYQPLAVMMLLFPIVSPIPVRKESTRSFLLALVAIVACSCAIYKIRIPYSWHSYRLGPMFVGRQWYRHSVYGPMIIETNQLDLFSRVCSEVKSEPPNELLSLPFPYANYFCSVAPWHGYVQTFFDTSSEETIAGLIVELQRTPPKWVLYQRQLDSLSWHEDLYNQGKPLPHRALDQLIEQKTVGGEWRTAFTSMYGDRPGWSNEWILISTRP